MAWSAPRTWVTAETVTAALMNAEIRDNLLATSAATVTTAGDIAFADAANSMGSRVALGAAGSHLVSTGSAPIWRDVATDVDTGNGTSISTSYTTLDDILTWNFTGEVEVTVTTGTRALVLFKAQFGNNTAGSSTYLSYSVSGATTIAASDNHHIRYESGGANDIASFGAHDLNTALTGGSNVFTLEGRVNGDTGTITRPEIAVIAF